MKHYPHDFKQALVDKFLSKPKQSIRKLAREHGIGKSSLHKWITEYVDINKLKNKISSNKLSAKQIMLVVKECEDLTEIEIGAYCRHYGIYRFDLEKWKADIMRDKNNKSGDKILTENKILNDKVKKLEKELRRTEKSLAETKALLELKKKVDRLLNQTEENQ